MVKKKWIVATCLVLAMGLTACGSKEEDSPGDNINIEDQQNDDELDVDKTEIPKDGDLKKYQAIKLTSMDAYNAFLEKKPGTKIKEIGLTYNHNRYAYKVEGYDAEKEYDLEIDALNGEILRAGEAKKEDTDVQVTLEDIGKIYPIVSKVLEQDQEGLIALEWNLGFKDAIAVLDVEIERHDEDNLKYKYDLNTGEIIE